MNLHTWADIKSRMCPEVREQIEAEARALSAEIRLSRLRRHGRGCYAAEGARARRRQKAKRRSSPMCQLTRSMLAKKIEE